MATKQVYAIGTDRNMNGHISVHKGRVVKAFANYTQVFLTPPEITARDEKVYAVLVDESKIVECQEGGDKPVHRLWEGPQGGRMYPQYMVNTEIRSLETGVGEQTNEELQSANEMLTEKLSDAYNTIESLNGNVEALNDLLLESASIPRAIVKATDAEIEALPYVGPSHVTAIRNWAKGLVAQEPADAPAVNNDAGTGENSSSED